VRAALLRQHMNDERLRQRAYMRELGDDAPSLRDWVWPDSQRKTAREAVPDTATRTPPPP
jgi:hypothetical protein